jgi:lipopolysaccharide export system permease protein
MLKKLDIYIMKKFLLTFVLTLGLFTLIIVVFDIAEKLDDFLENNAKINDIIFDYYLNFIPTILNMFSPIFIFISVIYFTSRLASRSEIISMLASGMTYDRILRPYFFMAALLAIFSYALNSWIIPNADKARVKFENEFVRNKHHSTENVHRQIKPDVYLFINHLYLDSNGTGIILEQFKGDTLISKLYARTIRWNYNESTWTLGSYMSREYLDNGDQIVTKGRSMDTLIEFNPENFFRRPEDINSFSKRELDEFIAAEKSRGAENVDFLLTEKHRRVSVPFATFILTFIGVCVSSRKSRGGIGLHLLMGLLLSIAYLFVYQVFITYGNSGIIPPAITVWITNILFALIGYYIYRKAPK